MNPVGQVLEGLLVCFIAFLWIRFLAVWVQVFARTWRPSGVMLVGLEVVFSVTDGPVSAVRRVVPSPRLGSVTIDVSLPIVLVGAYVLRAVLKSIFL